MAYLRKEQQTRETAHALNKVWVAAQKVLTDLQWDIEQIDNKAHHIKAKTKGSLLFFGSLLLIEMAPVDEKTTSISVTAETTVTTITAIVDFGQVRKRIELFFLQLEKQLSG